MKIKSNHNGLRHAYLEEEDAMRWYIQELELEMQERKGSISKDRKAHEYV